jgi:hypothetical protein
MAQNNQKYNENEYFIGFDLCSDYSLISYWDYIKNKPLAINPTGGYGSEQIPTVILYNSNIDEWLVGEEALLDDEQEGIYRITNLVEVIGTGAVYNICGKEYAPEEILAIFFNKIFVNLKKINPNSYMKAIMISTEKVDATTVKVITKALQSNDIAKENIHIQSHLESGIQYFISEEMPQKKAGIFEMSQNGLRYYQISVKNSSTVWQIKVDEVDYSEFIKASMVYEIVKEYILELYKKAANKESITIEEEKEIENVYYKNKQFIFSKISQNQKANIFFNGLYPPIKIEVEPEVLYKYLSDLDSRFEGIIAELLNNNLLPAVFLVGSGFEVPWASDSLKLLCKGRRVFQGQNLFSYGACYCVSSNYGICKKTEMIITGKGILSQDYGLLISNANEEKFVPVITAGTPWYSANNSIFVILDDINDINVIAKGNAVKEQIVCSIHLSNLPKRPNKTTKVRININFISEKEAKVEITDVGLGSIFPGTLRKWEQKFNY